MKVHSIYPAIYSRRSQGYIIGSRLVTASSDQPHLSVIALPFRNITITQTCSQGGLTQLATHWLLFFMMLLLTPLSAVGIRHNHHHANRRTPKLILLNEIFSTLLHGKPIPGITDYKQQQMFYQAGYTRLRTWRDLLEGSWTGMLHPSNALSYTLDKLAKKKREH